MNKKMLALLMFVVAIAVMSPIVAAQPPRITAWTDKSKYSPGDKGTINIAYYNDRSEAVEIKNMTVIFDDWNAYIGNQWVGNVTVIVGSTLTAGSVQVLDEAKFTVPTDGRAISTRADFTIYTDHGVEYGTVYITVETTIKSLDQIVSMFTILLVLLVVCSLIIAGAVFLANRRPQVTWSKEPKTE